MKNKWHDALGLRNVRDVVLCSVFHQNTLLSFTNLLQLFWGLKNSCCKKDKAPLLQNVPCSIASTQLAIVSRNMKIIVTVLKFE